MAADLPADLNCSDHGLAEQYFGRVPAARRAGRHRTTAARGPRPCVLVPHAEGPAQLLSPDGGVPQVLVAGIITSWWGRLPAQPDDFEAVAAVPRMRAAT